MSKVTPAYGTTLWKNYESLKFRNHMVLQLERRSKYVFIKSIVRADDVTSDTHSMFIWNK